MTRTVGTVVRGIRTPIIKEDTNLADVVVNSIMEAQKEEGFTFHDRDIIAITEAVVGISEGNFIKVDDITYTMPYELIKDTMFGIESENNINISLIKMSILSVIYVFVGLILFSKKKYEVVGTSFRSDNVHIFVRTLTTIPIICISYIILKDFGSSSYDFLSFVLLIVIIFT